MLTSLRLGPRPKQGDYNLIEEKNGINALELLARKLFDKFPTGLNQNEIKQITGAILPPFEDITPQQVTGGDDVNNVLTDREQLLANIENPEMASQLFLKIWNEAIGLGINTVVGTFQILVETEINEELDLLKKFLNSNLNDGNEYSTVSFLTALSRDCFLAVAYQDFQPGPKINTSVLGLYTLLKDNNLITKLNKLIVDIYDVAEQEDTGIGCAVFPIPESGQVLQHCQCQITNLQTGIKAHYRAIISKKCAQSPHKDIYLKLLNNQER